MVDQSTHIFSVVPTSDCPWTMTCRAVISRFYQQLCHDFLSFQKVIDRVWLPIVSWLSADTFYQQSISGARPRDAQPYRPPDPRAGSPWRDWLRQKSSWPGDQVSWAFTDIRLGAKKNNHFINAITSLFLLTRSICSPIMSIFSVETMAVTKLTFNWIELQ